MHHFLATDLDGTFLNERKDYNRDRFATLLSAYERVGGHFIVASGRDWKHVDELFAAFSGRVSYVVDNGATLISADKQFKELRTLSLPAMQEMMTMIGEMPAAPHGGVLFFGHNHVYAVRPYEHVVSNFLVLMAPMYGETIIVDNVSEIDEPIVKATAFYGEEASLALVELMADSHLLHATTPGMGVVDIMANGVDKASGLEKMLAYLGSNATDLMVFGDGLNDLEMMQLADQVYVMPNGDDKLKQFGYAIAMTDNQHDGVLQTWDSELNRQ